ncbi:class I tRNA ligase family protein [Fuerstiella marisgermanici]|uniref:Isoleucine--tRNA ligase n=1 Tax=Fuerstiella marisgermanici TaxID=1891926 RepID=A0A1P8W984_9PLAN|nr:class I tRNA ligase family protein [Fuerstiella marisgermanici]APZ90599.1 Isoleucine--tRNA ligase [Fuerstiella marisgermanici]
MFQPVSDSNFIPGEHSVLNFWTAHDTFRKLREKNRGGEKWSFLDGPITANNPMGVHHAWGRTYKDTYQRFFAMTGHDQRYQNGFDCQGLWVEVEVEKQLGLGTKTAVHEYGIDNFVNECKRRVLRFAARQTEQSQRLGYWMDWDDPDQLRELAEYLGTDAEVEFTAPSGQTETAKAHQLVEKLGNPEWGGSYFTFSTENNETIWDFLKKCFERGKVYQGHDVMPWSGRGGSAYSQMEIAEGRKLTTHKSVFVRFPLKDRENEFLLVWTTTPWTLTSNVGAAVNVDLDYVKIKAKKDDAVYYFAKENLNFQRLASEFKDGFGRPEWKWPEGVGKLKTIAQIFKEQGGFEELGTVKGSELVGLAYEGPFDDLPAQLTPQEALPWHVSRAQQLADNSANYIIPNPSHIATQLSQFVSGIRRTLDPTAPPNENDEIPSFQNAFIRSNLPASIAERFAAFVRIGCGDYSNAQSSFDREDLEIVNGNQALPSELDAQSLANILTTGLRALYKDAADWIASDKSAAKFHRVIDGGRDSRGNAHVVAGEGTGIVHMAPGCGDIDHKIGSSIGMPIIAPLNDDGTYGEPFGEFAGKEAIAPETAELVFEKLKEKGLLVAVETYPHIYPHCWRTGDELVFRLVDEWFINMDWRDEIKDVTKQIRWLPDSIDGQDREVEWLSNMSDWMISKKRFWGLALPIWVDEESGDFEVMGSLAELKERAVEGWDGFEGQTPHRPWIDGVKIRNPKTGNLMTRIEDVGNPWLDAGIVPFSTMNFNERFSTEAVNWADWYPADLVTECFPGQFRNWFYSMLSLSTMMMYDPDGKRTAEEKKPFRTLLGHRLVQNEQGQPMHKSDGTAIWFEEAAEQIGVDTMRWMYLQHNPATDLRFGTRHPDQPVTLNTPDGQISETKEGVPTATVTSGPADETRRQILIPLWNCYKFFVDYAIADGFVPGDDLRARVCGKSRGQNAESGFVPVADRPEIDRWLLSNLQTLIDTAHRELADYNAPAFCAAAAEFIDNLSNWYIRRNRRRFWRSKDASDTDKTAAYETLYEVLVKLCQLLAPCVPFLTERMYQNLVRGASEFAAQASPDDGELPQSVHLCDYPTADPALLDEALNNRMAAAQLVVKLGHKLREENTLRVRQPLAELQYATSDAETASAVAQLADVIKEELNIENVTQQDNLDDLVGYSYKPNLKTLGPKYGKLLGVLRTKLPELGDAVLGPLRRGESLSVDIDGNTIDLTPDDVLISTEQAEDWVCGDEAGIQIAISTVLTDDLIRKGMSRDFVRQVQQLRKDADLHIQDRIRIQYNSDNNLLQAMVAEWGDYICGETLADSIEFASAPASNAKSVNVGDVAATVWIVTLV